MVDYNNYIMEDDMSLSLDECIKSYDREISRKSALESKASALLSANAIVISLLIGLFTLIFSEFISFDYNQITIVINFIALYLIFVSIHYSLKALEIKSQYILPFEVKNPNFLEKKLKIDQSLLQEELFERYINCIPMIHLLNNDKSSYLIKSTKFLIIGLILAFVSLILIVFLRVIK